MLAIDVNLSKGADPGDIPPLPGSVESLLLCESVPDPP